MRGILSSKKTRKKLRISNEKRPAGRFDFIWSKRRESDPHIYLGKVMFYH